MAARHDFTDWSVVRVDAQSLTYRPSGRTLFRRLGATLLAVMIIGVMVWSFGFPPGGGASTRRQDPAEQAQLEDMRQRVSEAEESLRQTMTEAEWADFQQKIAQKAADRESERRESGQRLATVGAVGAGIYWAVFTLCVLGGVLVPLSSVWQRLTIEKDVRGDPCVTRRGLMRSSRTLARSDLADLCVFAGEVYHRQRRPYVERFLGWRWQVQLRSKAAAGGEDELVVFWPDMTQTLPPQMHKMTARVREFVG